MLSSLIFTLAATVGHTENFDRWMVARIGQDYVAVTLADNGASFGQVCTAGGPCEWTLLVAGSCNPGDTSPVLASSAKNAVSMQLTCVTSFRPGTARFTFSHPELIGQLASGSPRIGFALPLRDDQFRVTSFDLTGSTGAIARAGARAAARD